MKRAILFLMCLFLCAMASNTWAKTATFDFTDPKNVNAVSIVVDALLEPNVGFATPTTGAVTLDTDAGKIISGKISIPTSGITMSNPMMTKVLHSDQWLDAGKNPQVTFEYLQTISMGPMKDATYNMVVQGTMTLAGVTKKISAPVSITLLPGKVKDRNRSGNGDLVVLRSKLEISRKDFNLKPDMPETIVGDSISLVINLAGFQKP